MTTMALKSPSLIAGGVLLVCVLVIWIWVLLGDGRLLLSDHRTFLIVGVPLIFGGVLWLAIRTFMRRRSKVHRLASVVAVLLLLPLGLWVQRHTDLGVFALGGSSYWARKAARSADAEAIQDLNVILSATQYGVNAAERAVLEIHSREQRRRLFSLLAERAPTQEWAMRYRRLAEENR